MFKFHHKNIPFTLADNSEIEKINNSDTMKFCEFLPSFETILESNSILNVVDFDQNIPSLLNSKYYSIPLIIHPSRVVENQTPSLIDNI